VTAALTRSGAGSESTERGFPALRSAMPGVAWPAFPDGLGMMMLALQYQLERSEWWPAERLRAQQFRQLALLLEHAARESAFYRSRFRGAGIRPGRPLDADAWTRLPLLARRELQLHAKALRTAPPPTHGAVTHERSSGSSGMPVEVATTALAAMLTEAIWLRDHLWHGRDFAGRVAAIRRPRAGEATDTQAAGWTRGVSAALLTGGSVLLDALRPVSEQLEWLMRQDPDYLITYPSNLGELLRESQRKGLRPARLKSVLTQGEHVPPELGGALRAAWGVPLADTYSASEAGVMALQCPQSGHYHVQSEVALVEVLDGAGKPCAPGETGRVVVTPLHNFAQPLIRYDIGDFAEVGAPCACGRGLPTLARIVGRASGMMVLPSGAVVRPRFSAAIARAALPIAQFQIVQLSRERLEARLVVERSLSAAEEEALGGLLRAACGADLAVEFSYHAAIARGPGGKFEDFVSEVARP
jgi:phenylacetate-CoA ligase